MIRVAFILESDKSAAAYYRVMANIDAFEREGVDAYPMILARTAAGRAKMFRDVGSFDVAVLQRRLLQPWQFARLRRSVRALGYDFDDALLYRDRPGILGWRSIARSTKFRAITRGADFVTAGNEYLAGLAPREHRNVFVVPTPVDTRVYAPRPREDGPARIGWVGSASTVRYLEEIMPAVERVAAARPGVTLNIVSDAFPSERPFTRAIPWRRETEADEVGRFDIGLMPLPDNPWTRGKCGFKLLLYGASGIASVASPVGANRDILRGGETGLLAETIDDWESAILRLVDDAALRARMGAAARARVEAEYSVAAVIPKWAQILKRMAGGE